MRRIWMAAALVVGICGGAVAQGDSDPFSLSPPEKMPSTALRTLWATQYYVHQANAVGNDEAVPLLTRRGQPLGVRLSMADWCDAAMEGTVAVRGSDGKIRVFNYDGSAPQTLANCGRRFARTAPNVINALNRSAFVEVREDAPLGYGVEQYRLVAYRSVATDPKFIATGTVLYIPGLRGRLVSMPDNTMATHDGYVMAVDRGGSIKGDHIDLFTGLTARFESQGVGA